VLVHVQAMCRRLDVLTACVITVLHCGSFLLAGDQTCRFFSCMQHHVMGDLERKNFFFDPVHRQVQAIIPSLLKWVDDRLTQKAQATSFIDGNCKYICLTMFRGC